MAKEKLDQKVTSVESSDLLIGSPACILNADKSMTANMRRMMQAMNKDGEEALPFTSRKVPNQPRS